MNSEKLSPNTHSNTFNFSDLFGLSFLRLPMNILSQEMVERETKGFVTLNSLSNQT